MVRQTMSLAFESACPLYLGVDIKGYLNQLLLQMVNLTLVHIQRLLFQFFVELSAARIQWTLAQMLNAFK